MTADRRSFISLAATGLACAALPPHAAGATTRPLPVSDRSEAARREHFIVEAMRMRDEAVAKGDQPYGAVVVDGGRIVGWGPSRVVALKDETMHAEKVAIEDTRLRLGRSRLDGAVLYSTSRPCSMCEQFAAAAGIARMYWGPSATDAGKPSAP